MSQPDVEQVFLNESITSTPAASPEKVLTVQKSPSEDAYADMQLMLASEEFEEKVDPEFGIGLKLMFGRIIAERSREANMRESKKVTREAVVSKQQDKDRSKSKTDVADQSDKKQDSIKGSVLASWTTAFFAALNLLAFVLIGYYMVTGMTEQKKQKAESDAEQVRQFEFINPDYRKGK